MKKPKAKTKRQTALGLQLRMIKDAESRINNLEASARVSSERLNTNGSRFLEIDGHEKRLVRLERLDANGTRAAVETTEQLRKTGECVLDLQKRLSALEREVNGGSDHSGSTNHRKRLEALERTAGYSQGNEPKPLDPELLADRFVNELVAAVDGLLDVKRPGTASAAWERLIQARKAFPS